jgi:hypothetical protein
MTVTPAVPLSSSHATTCRMAEEQDRLKGFLGTANEMTSIAEVIAPATVAWVRSLSDTEIIPMGEKALGDIADNILVLDEIRQRFRKGLPILGYINWKEFVERNSKYSIRTIQRRLNEVNGKDETKVNDRFKTTEADAPPAVETNPVPDAEELAALLAPLSESELEADQKFEATLIKAPTTEPTPESDLARLRKLFMPLGLALEKSNHGSKYRLDKLTESQLNKIATVLSE